MNEIEICRLNIKRFRQLLDTEPDGVTRQIIENLLREFEDKLAASARGGSHARKGAGDIQYVHPGHIGAA